MNVLRYAVIAGLLPSVLPVSGQRAVAATILTVRDVVLRRAADLEPLGVNNFGDIGGTKHAAGNLLYDSGFEPIRMRSLYRVTESGVEDGRQWMRLDGPGTSNWLLFDNGTYSGAKIRGYRFVGADGRAPYREDRGGKKILDESAAQRCLPLPPARVLPPGTPGLPQGGWVAPAPDTFDEWQNISEPEKDKYRQHWRVFYEGPVEFQLDDVVIFEREFFWPNPAEFHPRTSAGGIRLTWEKKGPGSFRFVPHDANVPAEMRGGRGCLEMTPENGRAVLWYKLAGGTARTDAFWYGTLDEGVTYRYEAWVRGAGGTITLTFGEFNPARVTDGYFGHKIAQTFPLTPQWRRVGFEFVAPAPGADGIWGATLLVEDDAPVYVDNVKLQPVYESGDADRPFVIHRPLLKTLLDAQPAAGRKGALRAWFGLNSASMASLLDWYCESSIGLGAFMRIESATTYTLPRALTILEATGDAPETRMVPWLMGQVTHSEEEYRQLIEYLAAPYDPAKDSPKTKPMAHLRFTQRGHGRPWADDFREIILEFGNENWHNRAMANWIGMGRAGTVHQGGRAMGLWVGHMVAEIKKSPYWDAGKFRIAFGGNYSAGVNPDGSVSGYGQEGTVAAGGAVDYHSHATYIGPRWEVGEKSQNSIDDTGFQRTLFAHRGGNEDEWRRQQQAHERLREMGFNVRMSAYEGGPSGFGFRAKSPEEDRAGEEYGKSMAMGTAILDAWLNAWRMGWTHQCYLSFGQGRWWNSHVSRSKGHRPSPGWLAQTLINRQLANLDMLDVTLEGAPTVSTPVPTRRGRGAPVESRDIPMVHAHAFGGAGRYAVALANLHLTEAQPVEVQLPVDRASRIAWHYLKGDPRHTNLDALNVTLETDVLPADRLQNGRISLTLPAGAAGVLVIESAPVPALERGPLQKPVASYRRDSVAVGRQ